MYRQMLPTILASLLACSFGHATLARAADEEPTDEADVAACSPGELATDRAAARSYVLTVAQLKGLTAATVELFAAPDKSLAASVNPFYCLAEDPNDGSTVQKLTTAGAGRWFAGYPQVAQAYARHSLTARDVGLWAHLLQPLMMVATPEIAAMAPDVAAEAKNQLSAQQLAFAKQNGAGLKAWTDASSKTRR
jgi:hypothetical protein